MDSQLQTPPRSPPPAPPPATVPPLPTQINAATRNQHVKLNRLIMDRLPLALPPRCSNLTSLQQGLEAFLRIYWAFESVWRDLDNGTEGNAHEAQVQQWLRTLRPDGLERMPRLLSDLKAMSQRTGVTIPFGAENLNRDMLERVVRETQQKPHLLLAYGWVMYMAVFSGGRWIRQQLASAGGEFWISEADHDKPALELPGFSFLSFDGHNDGEDIKVLFKSRLAEAETLLTRQERQEVIEAAQRLFDDCIALVGLLDGPDWRQRVWKIAQWSFVSLVLVGFVLLDLRIRPW